MRTKRILFWALWVVIGCGEFARADGLELPAYSPVPHLEGDVDFLPYQRMNRYDAWQYVAPDRLGRWRPRVAYAPFGAIYLYNGAPFFFTPTRSREFMPYATD